MILILPLMWHLKSCPQSAKLWQWQKARVWAVMMGASLTTFFTSSLAAFIVFDLLAAMLVMMPKRGIPQRAIGGLFVLMAIMTIGFLASPTAGASVLYSHYTMAGWGQWGILFLWGLHDTGRIIYSRLSPARDLHPDKAGRS
jgi:hypothetical protein